NCYNPPAPSVYPHSAIFSRSGTWVTWGTCGLQDDCGGILPFHRIARPVNLVSPSVLSPEPARLPSGQEMRIAACFRHPPSTTGIADLAAPVYPESIPGRPFGRHRPVGREPLCPSFHC